MLQDEEVHNLERPTFRGADHFSPKLPAGTPKAINITLSFEEALKLHLGLMEGLGKLNSYKRNTVAGRNSAINLCVYSEDPRITINEGKLQANRITGAEEAQRTLPRQADSRV